ncbi:MAG: HEAT repeat domain-containing protein [Alkalispirochaeta sp.]
MHITPRLLSIPVYVVAALYFASSAFGQETLPNIEQLYLESGPSLSTLGSQIHSRDRVQQFLALSTLESQIESGLVDTEDPAVVDVLSPAVDQGVFVVSTYSDRPIERYDPMVRTQAVRILGEVGTAAAREKLQQSVLHDPEPIVRAQALLSLGRIAHDPDGNATQIIARRLAREHYTPDQFDPGVIDAALRALRAIVGTPDNVIDPAIREMLIEIAGDGRYSQDFRTRALEVLGMM